MHKIHITRDHVSTTEVGGLTAPSDTPTHPAATTLPLLERKEAETSAERPTAASESAPTVTAPQLKSKAGSWVPSILHQSWCQAQNLGTTVITFAR